MKKLFTFLALLAFAIGSFAQEIHYDFSVTNSTGYDIYYRIVDEENQQVEITYPCQHDDNYWWGYIKPEGRLILSDSVTYNGITYAVVAIGDHAFYECSDLRGELEFPQTISAIGAGAFKDCSYLSGNLLIPASITRIEDETFCGCSGFTNRLFLTDSLTYIGTKAFYQCAFKNVLMLPSMLTFIGDEAFKGCTHFNGISIKAVTPPTTGANAFAEVPTWISVAVPYTTKEAYQNASGWSRFAHHIVEKSYWNGKAEPWTKGSGTIDDPYLIESAENLAWLAKSVNEKQDLVIDTGYSAGGGMYLIYHYYDVMAYQDTCFRLVVDVDLRKGDMYWDPIGNSQYVYAGQNQGTIFTPHYSSLPPFNNQAYYYITYFSGQFDGDGHVISKANYLYSFNNVGNGYGSNYKYQVGLFGIVDNANIRNLTITSFSAGVPYGYPSGGLAGQIFNSNIYNCHTSGVIKHSNACGGIVGIANRSQIERCSAQIDFSASRAGGIVGVFVCDSANNSQNEIFDCSFVGSISGSYLAGGIVALCQSVSEGTGTVHINNCFSRETMTRISPDPPHYAESGDFIFGGIVGQVEDIDTLYILNCYTNDSIYTVPANGGNHQYYGGGILAYADANATISIKNCYHVGPIITQYKGGILAQNTNMTIVRNCYFEEDCAPDDGFGLPLNSDYMKTTAFVNRLNNGSSVFMMDTEPYENDGYPIFGTDGLIFVGAEWYYEILNDDGSITYQHLQCVGDTTINNERPKVIVRSNTQYDRDVHTEVTHEYVYEENGVVYWWNSTLGKFTVLYDFGAEVGDEWTIEVGNETITTKVYETDLQYIDGIPYKRLTIADPNNVFSGNLLGSIGHQTSFFPEKLMSKGKGYRVEGLRCYWLDDELVYKQGEEDCDAIYSEIHGVEEDGHSTSSGTLTIYPNPTNDVLFVETQNFASLPAQTYRITNVLRQTVLSGSIDAETQQIDIKKLPSGMYFITVGGQTVKFVVK